MSKFNRTIKLQEIKKTVNVAGGESYLQSNKLELASRVLTSFVDNKYYETSSEEISRIKELINEIDPLFVAKLAIYARKEFGMRSVTHVVAAELAKKLSGKSWAKDFYDKIINRPDDMIEILAYYFSTKDKVKRKNKSLPKSMQKGFSNAFKKFDAYQLAKYKNENKEFSLVDLVNIIHPVFSKNNGEVKVLKTEYVSFLNSKMKHFEKTKSFEKLDEIKEKISFVNSIKDEYIFINSIEALVNGFLKNTETTEAKMSKIGQEGSSLEEKSELKRKFWSEQLNSGKMPYFNLLRNLKNIIEQAPSCVDKACELLVNESSIKKSLVLPFRFDTALGEIEKMETTSTKEVRKIIMSLNDAADISCSNVPTFDGDTLIALDVSGSMSGKPIKVGSLFSAALIKANKVNADFMTFDGSARYVSINPLDSILTIANKVKAVGGSTDFKTIFLNAKKKYDRIIILSDMQSWVDYYCPSNALKKYKLKYNCNPYIYTFDLKNYGTMQFPEEKVFSLSGWSEKVFDVMKFMEKDSASLINTIENYTSF